MNKEKGLSLILRRNGLGDSYKGEAYIAELSDNVDLFELVYHFGTSYYENDIENKFERIIVDEEFNLVCTIKYNFENNKLLFSDIKSYVLLHDFVDAVEIVDNSNKLYEVGFFHERKYDVFEPNNTSIMLNLYVKKQKIKTNGLTEDELYNLYKNIDIFCTYISHDGSGEVGIAQINNKAVNGKENQIKETFKKNLEDLCFNGYTPDYIDMDKLVNENTTKFKVMFNYNKFAVEFSRITPYKLLSQIPSQVLGMVNKMTVISPFAYTDLHTHKYQKEFVQGYLIYEVYIETKS